MIFLIKNNKEYFYLYEYIYDSKIKKNCQIFKILSKKEIILKYEDGKIYKNVNYLKNLIKIKK